MQISRRKLLDMGKILVQTDTLFKKPMPVKFYYACAKNKTLATDEYKLYMESNQFPPQWGEYFNKRTAIINEIGESVKSGFKFLPEDKRDSIINSKDPNVMPMDKHELLVSRLMELDNEYKDLLEEVNNIRQKRDEFLDEEDDFPIKTVKLSEFPEIVAGNGVDIMSMLDPMIIEE